MEDIENIIHPKALERLEEEYLHTHNRLQQMPPSEMFTLCDHNHLPKIFLRLKIKPPPFMSCILGKIKRRARRNKEKNNKTICKSSHSKPGKCTSIDQIITAQLGLVPRISGRYTRERITSTIYFLDHKSSFVYSHLCILNSQEETLKSKTEY